jgi:hypothetical protein
MFAFAMNGEAFAKDKPKASAADKEAAKEHAQEHKAEKADADNKSGPLIRLHSVGGGSHSKPDSSWLNEKGHKNN